MTVSRSLSVTAALALTIAAARSSSSPLRPPLTAAHSSSSAGLSHAGFSVTVVPFTPPFLFPSHLHSLHQWELVAPNSLCAGGLPISNQTFMTYLIMAVMSSDISIDQFRYLERLLLVHGHWCYRKISSMVKGLLKEKKLEILDDPDLQNNYIEAEVEQLIQVALLCTQGSPMDRPKISEVVRMLEGNGLAKRWDEWQKVKVLRQDSELAPHPNSDWIVDSTENLHAVELSGPR